MGKSGARNDGGHVTMKTSVTRRTQPADAVAELAAALGSDAEVNHTLVAVAFA